MNRGFVAIGLIGGLLIFVFLIGAVFLTTSEVANLQKFFGYEPNAQTPLTYPITYPQPRRISVSPIKSPSATPTPTLR